MPPEESHYPRDWLRIAEKDWRRVDQALDDSDPKEQGSGFNRPSRNISRHIFYRKGGG